jgi:hypothetical protein
MFFFISTGNTYGKRAIVDHTIAIKRTYVKTILEKYDDSLRPASFL